MSAKQLIDFEDEYEHPNDDIEYVLENVLSEEAILGEDIESRNLRLEYNSLLLNVCQCQKSQDDFYCKNCSHSCNYKINAELCPSEFVLNPMRRSDIIYECSNGCSCNKEKCLNLLVQRGPRKHLKVIKSEKFKSKGLITTQPIPSGAFICEYAGELLTLNEAYNRISTNEKQQRMNYIICLNEIQQGRDNSNQVIKTIVDPTKKGNIGRYLNHSCDPNCEVCSVRTDCPVPKICMVGFPCSA